MLQDHQLRALHVDLEEVQRVDFLDVREAAGRDVDDAVDLPELLEAVEEGERGGVGLEQRGHPGRADVELVHAPSPSA